MQCHAHHPSWMRYGSTGWIASPTGLCHDIAQSSMKSMISASPARGPPTGVAEVRSARTPFQETERGPQPHRVVSIGAPSEVLTPSKRCYPRDVGRPAVRVWPQPRHAPTKAEGLEVDPAGSPFVYVHVRSRSVAGVTVVGFAGSRRRRGARRPRSGLRSPRRVFLRRGLDERDEPTRCHACLEHHLRPSTRAFIFPAWYELRTSGPASTCAIPSDSPSSFHRANSSGCTHRSTGR